MNKEQQKVDQIEQNNQAKLKAKNLALAKDSTNTIMKLTQSGLVGDELREEIEKVLVDTLSIKV